MTTDCIARRTRLGYVMYLRHPHVRPRPEWLMRMFHEDEVNDFVAFLRYQEDKEYEPTHLAWRDRPLCIHMVRGRERPDVWRPPRGQWSAIVGTCVNGYLVAGSESNP